MSAGAKVVAFGGGHGLSASLSALRRVTPNLTAVVTVGDDGGSSGVIRNELGVLPPGDLRMALAALAGDDARAQLWAEVCQHRFGGAATLAGHPVGNLMLVGLGEVLGDTVAALDAVGGLLGAVGRVLPLATTPIDIVAEVVGLDPAAYGEPGRSVRRAVRQPPLQQQDAASVIEQQHPGCGSFAHAPSCTYDEAPNERPHLWRTLLST